MQTFLNSRKSSYFTTFACSCVIIIEYYNITTIKVAVSFMQAITVIYKGVDSASNRSL